MKEKGPKISIVVPIYKVEDYLAKCLSSIISQTLLDIEVICVDDGTPDDSCRIVEKFMEKDNRISLLHKENGGLSSARNAGFRKAQGDYVWFVDADDYLPPYACERLYKEIVSNRPDIIVFSADPVPEIPRASDWTYNILKVGSCYDMKKKGIELLFSENGAYPFVWRDCFRRDFLIESKIEFDETIIFGEDMLYQFTAFPKAEKVIFISDSLYCYRHKRAGSLMFTRSKDSQQLLSEHLLVVKKVFETWSGFKTKDIYRAKLLEWAVDYVEIVLRDCSDRKVSGIAAQELMDMIVEYELLKYRGKMSAERRHQFRRVQQYLG